MRYNSIVIDTSNLFWRVAIPKIKENVLNKETIKYASHIEDVLKKLKKIEEEFAYENSKIFLLFDNPTSAYEIRRIISHGQYKHTRENKNVSKKIYHIIDLFEEIAKVYSDNYYIVKSSNHEADDLTKVIINQHPNDKVLCISADLDWARNITDNCHWYNWVTVYSPQVFEKKYGFNPTGQAIQIYKAIHGDNADSIKNSVPYLPKKYLIEIIQNCKTIKEVFSYVNENLPEIWKVRFKEAYSNIIENYALVQFYEVGLAYDNIVIPGKININKLKRLYTYLGLPFEPRMEESIFSLFENRKYV